LIQPILLFRPFFSVVLNEFIEVFKLLYESLVELTETKYTFPPFVVQEE